MLVIQQASTVEEFRRLERSWHELQRCLNAPPFLTFEWFRACIDAYGRRKSLSVIAVWDDTKLVGVAPLWYFTETTRGLDVVKLTPITCPDTLVADFLVDPDRREETLISFGRHLESSEQPRWDLFHFGKWAENSPNRDPLVRHLEKSMPRQLSYVDSLIPYVEIRGDWGAFLMTRSVKFRKTRRNIENRMARLPKVTVEMYQETIPSKAFADIVGVAARGWKNSRGVSLASSSEHLQFFENLLPSAAANGWLYAWILRVDGLPVAMELDLLSDGCAYALRSDFDPAFSDVSPGTYLETRILRHLFEHGSREYCTGPGLNDYKLHLTDLTHRTFATSIYNTTSKGILLWLLEGRLIPLLRIVRDCMGGDTLKNN